MRVELPGGTVTFLFTDVEGSTRLLDELGVGAYARVLAEHRQIVRDEVASFGGVEVDTQGDAFFLVFARAVDGVDAAAAITTRLASQSIRLRMGLHTGAPLLAEEGYVGEDVHRAARIAAAGHGGQVVSECIDRGAGRSSHARSGRTSFQGSARGGARLPARGYGIPAAQVALPLEPAGFRDAVSRTSHRARHACLRC